MPKTYNDCECLIHRYNSAHICICGAIVSHSQGAWDLHKNHGGMLHFDSYQYKHGENISVLWERLQAYGFLVSQNDFRIVWVTLMEKELI